MHEHRSEMSLAEQREVDSFLGPAARTSMPLRTRASRFVDATPVPPPSTGSPRTTCVPVAEDFGANQLVGDRFTIAWDGGATESQAEDLMEALDASYDREIDELGWKEPIGMDAFNLWVYIDEGDGGHRSDEGVAFHREVACLGVLAGGGERRAEVLESGAAADIHGATARMLKTIAADDEKLLARRSVPARRPIVKSAVADVEAIDDGVSNWPAALDNSAAHGRFM